MTHVIATTACGSLIEEYAPGDLVVLSDYIDMTKTRLNTHMGTAVDSGGPSGHNEYTIMQSIRCKTPYCH